MKIRQGFVSNSSSSSFCLLGVRLNQWPSDEEYKNILNNRRLDIEEGLEQIDGVVVGIYPNDILKQKDKTVREILNDLVSDLNQCLVLDNPVTIDDIRVYSDQGYEG